MRGIEQFKAGFFRKLGFIAATLLVAWAATHCAPAKAQAQPPLYDGQGDKTKAKAACESFRSYSKQLVPSGAYECRVQDGEREFACLDSQTLGACYGQFRFPWTNQCPNKPSVFGGTMQLGQAVCYGGCEYTFDPMVNRRRDVGDFKGNSISIGTGYWKPSGAECEKEEDMPPPKDEFCVDVGSGYKMCPKTDGDGKCVVSAKTNRRYCDNGQGGKATNPNRTEGIGFGAGDGVIPGPPEPRAGENWGKIGGSNVTNTTTNNTSITNIFGQAGSANTNPGSGVDGDGSGNQGSGETGGGTGGTGGDAGGGDGGGDEDEDDTPAQIGGGDTCANPPAALTGGGSDYQFKIVLMQWLERCEGLAGTDQAVADAAGEVNALLDTYSSWTGAFDGEQLDKYLELRQDDAADLRTKDTGLLDGLDTDGFLSGGASCPDLPSFNVGGTSFALSMDKMCAILIYVGYILEALAYVLAVRIISRGG